MTSRPRRTWREQVLGRADQLAALAVWLDSRSDGPSTPAAGWAADAVTDQAMRRMLASAVDAAQGLSFWPGPRGARMERAFCSIDGAQAEVLRRMPGAFLLGLLPDLVLHVRAHLPPGVGPSLRRGATTGDRTGRQKGPISARLRGIHADDGEEGVARPAQRNGPGHHLRTSTDPMEWH